MPYAIRDWNMDPEEYKRLIARFEFRQEEAAVFFGQSPRTGQRWCSGEREIPTGVAIALRLMVESGKTLEQLGVDPSIAEELRERDRQKAAERTLAAQRARSGRKKTTKRKAAA